eukprot:CAMPEP_0170320198 /NCGR_PEP_ID=MMETSP0116_2-20130129/60826_1 /TAXON_ID=400756 /ORGANISM="Durinskia baltica, Strain CSIRO CS-38" /LENGTH=51 /DNA_ID=CAMNT_0010572955 /DNA_START=77 /DNA_END=228 /DNA_ORIENTATION=+
MYNDPPGRSRRGPADNKAQRTVKSDRKPKCTGGLDTIQSYVADSGTKSQAS